MAEEEILIDFYVRWKKKTFKRGFWLENWWTFSFVMINEWKTEINLKFFTLSNWTIQINLQIFIFKYHLNLSTPDTA